MFMKHKQYLRMIIEVPWLIICTLIVINVQTTFTFCLAILNFICMAKILTKTDIVYLHDYLEDYKPLEMLGKLFCYEGYIYKPLKYICLNEQERIYECLQLETGKKQIWYEDELITGIANDEVKFLKECS